MTPTWTNTPFDAWQPTCDTLHAHAQLLGKLSAALLPPEPHHEHLTLRFTARGIETRPLPAPNGSGAFAVALDLHTCEAIVEHSDGSVRRIPLAPDRPVGEVTRGVLGAVHELAGEVVLDLKPSEVAWTTPLDEDEEHRTLRRDHVAAWMAAATRSSLVLAALRAPWPGRTTPVNLWSGSFDLAVSLFSSRIDGPQEVAVGWWPGDPRYPKPAFYGYASPAPDGLAATPLPRGRYDEAMHEFLLDDAELASAPDPHAGALEFGLAIVAATARLGGWAMGDGGAGD